LVVCTAIFRKTVSFPNIFGIYSGLVNDPGNILHR